MCLQSWSYMITNEIVTFRFTSIWADFNWIVGVREEIGPTRVYTLLLASQVNKLTVSQNYYLLSSVRVYYTT